MRTSHFTYLLHHQRYCNVQNRVRSVLSRALYIHFEMNLENVTHWENEDLRSSAFRFTLSNLTVVSEEYASFSIVSFACHFMMRGKSNIEIRAIVVSIHFIISIISFSNVELSTIYFVVCSKLPFYVSPCCKVTYRHFELVLDTNDKATLLTCSSWSRFVRVLFIISIGSTFNSHLIGHEKNEHIFQISLFIFQKNVFF